VSASHFFSEEVKLLQKPVTC